MDPERQKEIFNRCDPKDPLDPGDPRYEPFDAHGLRGEPAADRVLRTIRLSNAPTTQLFTGLIGSGKSTELRRFADMARAGANVFVALADIVDRDDPYLVRSEPLEVSDLLFTVCLAIADRLEQVGAPVLSRLDTPWQSFKTQIGIEPSLNLGLAGVSTKFTAEPSFRSELRGRQRDSPLKFKRGVDDFIRSALEVVRTSDLGSNIVVVLDGLEKVADFDAEGDSRGSAFRDVFLNNAELLRLPCHVVYPVAPFMIQHSGELGPLYDAEPVMLPMVRVRHRNEVPDESGMIRMIEALDRRVGVDRTFDGRETAETLVLQSGGYMRDLLRLVRESIQECPVDHERITGDTARIAVRRIQRTYREGLFEEYRAPLARAHKSKGLPLSAETRPLLGRLLRAHMLLRYHNDDEWYDAHPLLWDLIGSEEG